MAGYPGQGQYSTSTPGQGNLAPLSYPSQSYGGTTHTSSSSYNKNYNIPNSAPSAAESEVMLWFQAVDADRSGYISAAELRQALANANWSLFNDDACRLMIGMFDRDHGNSIDIHEFQQLWQYLQQWQKIFQDVDRNRSGYIEQDELQQALSAMGYQLSPEFIRIAVARFDYSRQNRISLDSFIVCCVLLHRLTESFKQKDTDRKGEIKVAYEDFMLISLNGLP